MKPEFTLCQSFGTNIMVAFLIAAFGLMSFGLLVPAQAKAAELKGYETVMVMSTGAGQISMRPDERKTVTINFQNTGSKSWSNDGPGYISIYTYGPKYRKSVFDPGTWEWSDHPTRIQESSVPVNGVATISFELHAPNAEGTYQETFNLASEDTAWIPGGEFTLNIIVDSSVAAVSPVQTVSNSTEPIQPSVEIVNGYGASLAEELQSVSVRAGSVVEYTVSIKNEGTKTWYKRRLQLPSIMMASTSSLAFHSSWLTRNIPVARSGAVAAGQTDSYTFRFTAPTSAGSHLVSFQFVADETEIPGGEINIPVTVTSGAGDAYNSARDAVPTLQLIDEPVIRVATMIVDEETDWEVTIASSESDIELRDEQGNILANVEPGTEILAYYDNSRYYYDVGRGLEHTSYPLRFIPTEKDAILEVTNFDRRETRSSAYADNTFRNILELRYNSAKDRTWLINELDMEMYLRGLAETSNSSPLEFQKTLITAARTYAFYHFERATKHDEEGYHVDAYWDQVYKGYGQEQRTPNLTQAVQETEGTIVQYDGETAITPYFSRSDGRTRDWSDVWFGEVEWCQSVTVPCDVGKTLWGHGVGMSASGALCMAKGGDEYDEILKYFYTGIDLVKRW
ncbi:MAG: SpoIID/LytB domain-containing protein [Candidatus Uhrbacteria bacterium]|nr:hypothetical protein [Patescibacteria group bacterium]MBU1907429.1 hypothetical protein [Patescibacteria group bacterium]